jgi:predicted amidophosphoribosyltransferase
MDKKRRMVREKKTVSAMIEIYCRRMHKTHGGLCDECGELQDYAGKRLDGCTFQESKTTCANCSVHCYKPSMREKIKSVMHYAGPRMIYHHPLLAAFHFADGLRKQSVTRYGKKP